MKIIGVTNRKLCDDFYQRIREIAKENKIDYLVLREKDLIEEELEIMAARIKGILKDSKIKLIINSNVKIADNINAYGVQLSYKDYIEGKSKGYDKVVGVSVHSLDEAINAEKLGASYILYGHVFETDCKKDLKPRGLDELKNICEKLNINVFAIGGINKENYLEVLKVGTAGVAIMSSLMQKSNDSLA